MLIISLILFIIFYVLFLPLVQANMVEKPLNISISNCYNVSIVVSQEEGAPSDVAFTGCSKVNAEEYYCNCYNGNNNNFSIIMQSDNYPVRELRNYKIEITAQTFSFKPRGLTTHVIDAGEYIDLGRDDWKTLSTIQQQPTIVNRTVYVDKVVYQDRVEYVDRNVSVVQWMNNTEYVNNTVYVENTTRIKELENKQSWNKFFVIAFAIMTIALIVFIMFKMEKGDLK